ncbi:adhesion G protein-coupled receptor E5-like [Osmerus mordax]|uniref:adhesion G protein-coupled receptor E5-like n=1 Tax=Osmerus mordax TaxID=8014 RepID=UPI0035104756
MLSFLTMISRECLLMLALLVSLEMVLGCPQGFQKQRNTCIDIDECEDPICVEHAQCFNTNGSYYCRCHLGFTPQDRNFNASESVKCQDVNECAENEDICGPNSECINTMGNYSCTCLLGFVSSNGKETFLPGEGVTCNDRDECEEDDICGQHKCNNTQGSYQCVCDSGFRRENDGLCKEMCKIDPSLCGNGNCTTKADGYNCACHVGFTNYGNEQSRCKELNCETFNSDDNLEMLPDIQNVMTLLRNSCLELSETEGLVGARQVEGEFLLEALLSMIDGLLQGGPLNDNRKMTVLLEFVENALKLIGPMMNSPRTSRSYNQVEVELLKRGADVPWGAVSLSSKHTRLNSSWETAAGDASSYPGFATISLLTYKGLHTSKQTFFRSGKKSEDQTQLNSKVVTVSVSNTNTTLLTEPVVFTFYHLQQSDNGSRSCVYWEPKLDGGSWSDRGCTVLESETDYTVCSCSHLSSFAVLMALHEVKDEFQLRVITWVGLSLSLVCLFLCILTFTLFRSIQSTRNTIHLHLCISLFIADFVFLAGITRTENPVSCGIVAGLLHYFFLAAFCWMCLEGVQLFRMVVLVFNTTFKPLYMMAGGYGVPAIIVLLSAIINAKGYGTTRYCWLSLEDNFIWSFFGPVCVIIMVNVFFFLITVWKLAQKFSSLNPDLDNLRKIKAFTITAVAQLCVLGTMWIFGVFQFDQGTLAMSYLFTILNSLQGVLIFVMHCLLSKPVREEYSKFLSRVCAPEKKKYSEFSSNQTSKSQTSKSAQNTGESHI